MTPIIDTHVHLWDLNRFELPWLESSPKLAVLARCFTPADYLAAAGDTALRAVYMEVDVDPRQQGDEADWIVELCQRGGTPIEAAVIAGHPGTPRFRDHVGRFVETVWVKGVRQVLHGPATPRGHCVTDPFVADIGWLSEQGLSFDLCLRPGELADGARLASLCPRANLILDHCGNPSGKEDDRSAWKEGAWEEGFCRLAERPNVSCKVSGLLESLGAGDAAAERAAKVIETALARFGSDRLLFGGNWPVCNLARGYGEWRDLVRRETRAWPAAAQRALFHDNAVRIYRLPARS